MKDSVAPNIRSAAELFRAQAPFIARLLGRVGVAQADIDDAVQEVFLVAHRRGGFEEGVASERTWLAEIALRVASNLRRSKRRRPTLHDDAVLGGVESRTGDPHASAETRERVERLAEALDALSEEARLVFVLIEIEGCSADEVAKARGIPVGTVYSRLHNARKIVRASYEQALSRRRPSLGSLASKLGFSSPLGFLTKKELAR